MRESLPDLFYEAILPPYQNKIEYILIIKLKINIPQEYRWKKSLMKYLQIQLTIYKKNYIYHD